MGGGCNSGTGRLSIQASMAFVASQARAATVIGRRTSQRSDFGCAANVRTWRRVDTGLGGAARMSDWGMAEVRHSYGKGDWPRKSVIRNTVLRLRISAPKTEEDLRARRLSDLAAVRRRNKRAAEFVRRRRSGVQFRQRSRGGPAASVPQKPMATTRKSPRLGSTPSAGPSSSSLQVLSTSQPVR